MSSVASGPRGRYDDFWSRSSLLVAASIMAEGNKKHQPTEHQNALIDHYESRVTHSEEYDYHHHFNHNNNNQDTPTDDPLIQWLGYVQYVQTEFPDDTSTKLLLMERCTWALAHSRQYANDDRFLRICMQYAVNTTDPLHDIFEYLDMCHVGRKVSWFWVKRACLAEDAGDYALAKRLLEQGKTYDAQPADELAKHYTALLERMIDVFLAEQKNRHDDYGTGHADDTVGNLRNGNAKWISAATEVRHKAARVPSPQHQVLDHVQSNMVERRGDFSEQLFHERARSELALIDSQRHANTQNTDSKPAARHGGKGQAMEQALQVAMPPNVGKVSSAAAISPVARRAPTQDSTPGRTFQSQSNIGDNNKENCPSTKNSPSAIKESFEKKRPAKRARLLRLPEPGPVPDVPVARVKQEQQDCPVVIEIADSDDEEDMSDIDDGYWRLAIGQTAPVPYPKVREFGNPENEELLYRTLQVVQQTNAATFAKVSFVNKSNGWKVAHDIIFGKNTRFVGLGDKSHDVSTFVDRMREIWDAADGDSSGRFGGNWGFKQGDRWHAIAHIAVEQKQVFLTARKA